MAKANPSNSQPPSPVSDPPTPQLGVITLDDGVEIQYIGEGAENVTFTRNPNAAKYVVHASGQVMETLK